MGHGGWKPPPRARWIRFFFRAISRVLWLVSLVEMTAWIDAHHHLQDSRLRDPGLILGAMAAAGVVASVVNATFEGDWRLVEELAEANPERVWPAYGVHPWKAHTVTAGWVERLRIMLEADPRASVGEIGLDQWVTEPGIEVQRTAFKEQLSLARELGRPATIHCLKAWGPLFEVFDACAPPPGFLMHSFNGSIEVARRLLPMGAYFSFSGNFLHQRKAKVVEVFQQLPKDRILLETDAPDMLPPDTAISHPLADEVNHPANLPAIGEQLAKLLGMTADELAGVTSENARRLMGGL